MAKTETDTHTQATPSVVLLLDNNAIQHILSKNTASLFEPILIETKNNNVELAVSDIVIYEALKAIVFNPSKVQPVADFIDNTLVRYPVNHDVLINAAKIHEMYGANKNVRPYRDKISSEDIIIATTSMMLGAYILTSDCNDFPRPFFKETEKQIHYYTEKGRSKHIIVYILEPDMTVIEKALMELA